MNPLRDLEPLARLRIAFIALGLLLLVPFSLLLSRANERIEEQRRLRHQMVSERIFDELERELTALLDSESRRPSRAYDRPTSPEAWAPFIVGYFTANNRGQRYVAERSLSDERRARLEGVLDGWHSVYFVAKASSGPNRGVISRPPIHPGESRVDSASHQRTSEQSPAVPRKEEVAEKEADMARQSSPDVLRRLNRGKATRRQARPAMQSDPLEDYGAF